jgi:uncharacterized protein YggE
MNQPRPIAAALVLGLLGCFAASAQTPGITVVGHGLAEAKPTHVTITALVSAQAPVAADAVVKYRDARRRAVEAIEGLEISGLSIEGEGFVLDSTVNQQQMQAIWQGQAPQQIEGEVRVSEALRITITGIAEMEEQAVMDTLINVLDAAKESGLTTGAAVTQRKRQVMYGQSIDTALATFGLEDPAALQQQASEAAVDDARAQAQRLAELAGVELGAIEAITPQDASQNNQVNAIYVYGMSEEPDERDRHSREQFGVIGVRAALQVRFAIHEGAKP